MSDPRFFDLPGRRPTIGATSVRAIPEMAPAADLNDPAVLDLLLKQIIEGGISGATLPGDAYNKGMTQAEMERRALDTVGLVGVSSPIGVPRGALGSGPVRRAPAPERFESGGAQWGREDFTPVQQPYSVLSEELGNTQRKSGTIGEFAAELGNKPGVKPEELDFVFGDKDPNQRVTIDEVVKMLEGTPEIQTTVKNLDPYQDYVEELGDNYNPDVPMDAPSQLDDMRPDILERNYDFLLSGYYAAHGTDSVPLAERRVIEARAEEMTDAQIKFGKDVTSHMTEYNEGDYRLPHPDQRDGGTGGYEEVIIHLPQKKGGYNSGHWDEKDVILHQRRDVREVGGKQSLHIDEMQSDTHQAGRDRGYTDEPPPNREELVKMARRNGVLEVELYNNTTPGIDVEPGKDLLIELQDGRLDPRELPPGVREMAEEYMNNYDVLYRTKKPPSSIPFKKSWMTLGLKRAVTDAIEKGLDRVSWTGGANQNVRWSKDMDDRSFIGPYDEMLPAAAKKAFKKYGVEVKRTKLNDQGVVLEQTPEFHDYMRNFEETNPTMARMEELRQQHIKAVNAGKTGPEVEKITAEMSRLSSDVVDARREAHDTFLAENNNGQLSKARRKQAVDKEHLERIHTEINPKWKPKFEAAKVAAKDGGEKEIDALNDLYSARLEEIMAMRKEIEDRLAKDPQYNVDAYGFYFDITPELKKAVQEKGLPLFNKGLPVQGPPKNGDQYLDRILRGDII